MRVGAKKECKPLSINGYSLVEILVVMGLILMLSLLAAPSLYRLLTAQGLSVATRDVSNQLVKARTDAIVKQTLTRFMVATTWPTNEEKAFTMYSIWKWNTEERKFERSTAWSELPGGIVFESEVPQYINQANYVQNDATSIHGEDAMALETAMKEIVNRDGVEIQTQFVEFMPNGAARIPGGKLKKVIYILTEQRPKKTHVNIRLEEVHKQKKRPVPNTPRNWSQVNLDTLTGRVRIYRP